jgi:hypothetical protein
VVYASDERQGKTQIVVQAGREEGGPEGDQWHAFLYCSSSTTRSDSPVCFLPVLNSSFWCKYYFLRKNHRVVICKNTGGFFNFYGRYNTAVHLPFVGCSLVSFSNGMGGIADPGETKFWGLFFT